MLIFDLVMGLPPKVSTTTSNWKYAAFTGFVLAVLTYSLFLQ